jgi:hypothetical protein
MNINCNKNKILKRLPFFFATILLVSFYYCGFYSFTGSSIPGHIKTIAVPLFEDQTSEFQIKEQLTDFVIDEITRDNSLKIVNEAQADAIVYGTIVRISDQAHTYDQNEQVESYRVWISVQVEVKDVKNATNMWKETWRQWGEYTLDPAEDERLKGIEDALKKIAEDVLTKTVSGW